MTEGVAATPETTLKLVEQVGKEITNNVPDDEWRSTRRPGLVFKLRKMSRMALVEAGRKVQDPKVPVVWIEDKQRDEPNPNDPDYREALTSAAWTRSIVVVNTCVVLGTNLISKPDELEDIASEDWVEQLMFIGLSVPDGKYARYAAWVRYHALDDEELTALIIKVQRYNGIVTEQDVDEAAESFKSDETRDTDNTVQPAATS